MKNLLISIKAALSDKKNFPFMASMAILSFTLLFPFEVFSQDLAGVNSALNGQKVVIKTIVQTIIGIVFMIGVIHVAVVFSQGQQNAKDIALKYFAGVMIFSVIWLIIP